MAKVLKLGGSVNSLIYYRPLFLFRSGVEGMSGKILRNFVSEIDQFINAFDKEHPELSKSQQKEIEKYNRIFFLRDKENHPEEKKDIFE